MLIDCTWRQTIFLDNLGPKLAVVMSVKTRQEWVSVILLPVVIANYIIIIIIILIAKDEWKASRMSTLNDTHPHKIPQGNDAKRRF